jgi:hypothetical protein
MRASLSGKLGCVDEVVFGFLLSILLDGEIYGQLPSFFSDFAGEIAFGVKSFFGETIFPVLINFVGYYSRYHYSRYY